MAPLIPSRAGDYLLGELLAEGGFGVVCRAQHAESGTPAAVKILHPELVAHPDVLLRFEREVEVIRRLRHPNVVEIFDYGRLEDGRPYYAMELLSGVSVEQHLRTRGRLPPHEALAILEPLCAALEVAHAQAIVHRDIKPSNAFLCDEGGALRVVLLDFGVAKLLDAPGPALTASRHVVGTLTCTAPEQLLGRPVDARTDVYALGALAYTMLTGEPPFTGSAYPVLRQLHLHGSPPRPSSHARVSPALDDVVLRAMRKDPTERQPSATAFFSELRAAVEQTGTPQAGVTERRALGVYAEVRTDADALDDPDDRLLADLEAILPFITSELSVAGLSVAVETGSSALFTVDLPDARARDEAIRRNAVDAVLTLHRRLSARADRDPRVHVRLCLHTGTLHAAEDGSLVGGALLELSGWVPDVDAEGIFASRAALAALDIPARSDPAAGAALLRVEVTSRGAGVFEPS